MQPYTYTTPRTARYYCLGQPSPSTQQVWFCLHGENQPVSELVAQIDALDTPGRLLVLPEALSRYGLPPDAEGNRRIGADWFAIGDLALDFTDLSTYLDGLAAQILAACSPTVSVTVLGCGHGAAAACRWLASCRTTYDRLILYAAVFPPAIDRRATLHALPDKPITVVATTIDAYKSEADGRALVRDLEEVGRSARLQYVSEGPLTLAALGAVDGSIPKI